MYCYCGGELRVKRRLTQCLDDWSYVIVTWGCPLCEKEVPSRLLPKESDWK